MKSMKYRNENRMHPKKKKLIDKRNGEMILLLIFIAVTSRSVYSL